MDTDITSAEVCRRLNLSDDLLEYILSLTGAPHPYADPTGHGYTWTEQDVAALASFIDGFNRIGMDLRDGI